MTTDQHFINGGTGFSMPQISRHTISEYQSYEVKDIELEFLKKGGDGGIYLNISIAFFSSSVSMAVTYFLTDLENEVKEAYLISAIIFTALLGIVFLIYYKRSHQTVGDIYDTILSRKTYSKSSHIDRLQMPVKYLKQTSHTKKARRASKLK